MDFQNIVNFLDISSDKKFVAKKWIEVSYQSEGNYNVNKESRIKTAILRSDLCDFSDVYIVLKENINKKKHLLPMILKHLIIQQLMQLLLILQIIMRLVKKNWFLKIIHHLLIVFQQLMV